MAGMRVCALFSWHSDRQFENAASASVHLLTMFVKWMETFRSFIIVHVGM